MYRTYYVARIYPGLTKPIIEFICETEEDSVQLAKMLTATQPYRYTSLTITWPLDDNNGLAQNT